MLGIHRIVLKSEQITHQKSAKLIRNSNHKWRYSTLRQQKMHLHLCRCFKKRSIKWALDGRGLNDSLWKKPCKRTFRTYQLKTTSQILRAKIKKRHVPVIQEWINSPDCRFINESWMVARRLTVYERKRQNTASKELSKFKLPVTIVRC